MIQYRVKITNLAEVFNVYKDRKLVEIEKKSQHYTPLFMVTHLLVKPFLLDSIYI